MPRGRRKSSDSRIEGFAEDLGRLLGTARAKADSWLGQRQEIQKRLTEIRDTASGLLQQLSTGGTALAAAVRRGAGRGAAAVEYAAQPVSRRKRRKLSAKARKAISDAQK